MTAFFYVNSFQTYKVYSYIYSMKLSKWCLFLCLLMLVFSSCEKSENNRATISFQLISTNKTPIGRNYSIDNDKTKLLFSNFLLTDVSGNKTLLKDVFLYKKNNTDFEVKIPEGNYTTFQFSFGLDAITNNANPINFPASHPLSVEEGLYWDMLKYRFAIIEAMVDNSPTKNQTPNTPISMHLGSDTLYTVISSTTIPKNGMNLQIQFNLDSLFVLDAEPFQISNFSNHSESAEIARTITIKNSFINSRKISLISN